ncbi:MAG: hypothetical protein P8Y99_15155 [Calditrichaceae bacterium]
MHNNYNISDPEYKRIKFEIFEKDSFRCQFCGAGAPIAALRLRRIQEAEKQDEWLNTAFLSTSCTTCEKKRAGVNAKDLADGFISIDELEERLQQLKMLINWRKGMLRIRKQQLENLVTYWEKKVPGFQISNEQKKHLLSYMTKYAGEEIRDAMNMAADKFINYNADGSFDTDSINQAFSKIQEICLQKTKIAANNETDGLHNIHQQLKNNINGFFDPHRAAQWLTYARSWEVKIEELAEMAQKVNNWTEFAVNIDKMVEAQKYILSRGRVTY